MRRFVYVSTLLATLAAPAGAFAVDVVVGTGDCASAELTDRVRQTRSALERQDGITLLPESTLQQRLGADPTASLAEAERLLSTGRFEFYEAGSAERAQRSLESTLEQLRRVSPSEERWRAVRETKLMLAQVSSRKGLGPQADAHLLAVLRVEPEVKLDPSRFSPAFRRHADALRRQLLQGPRHRLQVGARRGEDDAGWSVFVDGRPLGKTPLAVTLPEGTYRVETGTGMRRTARRDTALRAPVAVMFDVAFEQALFPDRGPCFTSGLDRESRLLTAVRLGALLEAQRLLLVRIDSPNEGEAYDVGTLVDVGSAQEIREGRVRSREGVDRTESLERLAAFLSTGRLARPVEPISREAPALPDAPTAIATRAEPQSVPERSAVLKTTGLVSMGLGAGVIAGSAVWLVGGLRAASDAREACPGSSCASEADAARFSPAENARKKRMRNAWVFGLSGAALTAAGAWLHRYGATPSFEPSGTAGLRWELHPSQEGAMFTVSGHLR